MIKYAIVIVLDTKMFNSVIGGQVNCLCNVPRWYVVSTRFKNNVRQKMESLFLISSFFKGMEINSDIISSLRHVYTVHFE